MRGPGPGCVGPRTVLVDKVRNIGRLVGGIPKTLLQPRLRALFVVIVSGLGDFTGEGSQLTSIGHASRHGRVHESVACPRIRAEGYSRSIPSTKMAGGTEWIPRGTSIFQSLALRRI